MNITSTETREKEVTYYRHFQWRRLYIFLLIFLITIFKALEIDFKYGF